jgi:hypothetical protein
MAGVIFSVSDNADSQKQWNALPSGARRQIELHWIARTSDALQNEKSRAAMRRDFCDRLTPRR